MRVLPIVLALGFIILWREEPAGAAENVDISVEYHQEMARPIADMINKYRASGDAWYWNYNDTEKIQCGYLPALEYDYELEKVAMQRAAELAVLYSHTRPNGGRCFSAHASLGYFYYAAGENIAAGYLTAESAHRGWMEEAEKYSGQGHRRNILDANFGAVGIACVYSEGYYYWVEEFADTCKDSTPTTAWTGKSSATVVLSPENIRIEDLLLNERCESLYDLCEDGPAIRYYGENIRNKKVNYEEYIGLEPDQSIKIPVTGISFSYSGYPSKLSSKAVMVGGMQYSIADKTIAKIKKNKIVALHCGATELIIDVFGEKLTIPVIVEHKYKAVIQPATGLADGRTATKCVSCGKEIDSETVPRIQSAALESISLTYNGKYRKPAVIVKDRRGNVISSDNYDVKYSNHKKVGTATATVTFKGKYAGQQILTFTINPKPVKISSVSTKKNVVVKWKKLTTQCDGYEAEYADNRAFTLNRGVKKVEGRTKTSVKLPVSKRNGKRFVRIRSYKAVNGTIYYSEWSDIYMFEY